MNCTKCVTSVIWLSFVSLEPPIVPEIPVEPLVAKQPTPSSPPPPEPVQVPTPTPPPPREPSPEPSPTPIVKSTEVDPKPGITTS